MSTKAPAVLLLIRKLIDWISAALMLSIAALASLQVMARYVFGLSTPWSEELLRLMFVAVILLTAAFATHQRVDVLDNKLGPVGRRVQIIVNALFSAAMLAMMVYYGMDLVELTANDRFTALPLSVQWIYWALVVGSALWLVRTIAELFWSDIAEGNVEL